LITFSILPEWEGYNLLVLPAIFLDRDGVIIENRPDYVRTWEDVVLIPGALQAIVNLKSSPYRLVIVTNQAGVGRGFLSLDTANQINARLVELINQAGGRIDGVFLCPHLPEDGCDCRKPRPGMILQASERLGLDLNRSILIGDALSDIHAGQSAGIPQNMLVRTGRGRQQEQSMSAVDGRTIPVFDTLADALAPFTSKKSGF
jgi:D-glycero-D-manno-heptose 1,7-bisphosphate phosphatase